MSLLFILDEQNNSSQISEPHNFWKKMHTTIPVCYFVRKKVPVWFDERQEVPVWHTVSYRPTSSTELTPAMFAAPSYVCPLRQAGGSCKRKSASLVSAAMRAPVVYGVS